MTADGPTEKRRLLLGLPWVHRRRRPPVTGRARQADGTHSLTAQPQALAGCVRGSWGRRPFLPALPALSAPSILPLALILLSVYPDLPHRWSPSHPFAHFVLDSRSLVSDLWVSSRKDILSTVPSPSFFFFPKFPPWRGGLIGRANRSRCRQPRRGRTIISYLAMASTGRSSLQTFADIWGTTHWSAPAPMRYCEPRNPSSAPSSFIFSPPRSPAVTGRPCHARLFHHSVPEPDISEYPSRPSSSGTPTLILRRR